MTVFNTKFNYFFPILRLLVIVLILLFLTAQYYFTFFVGNTEGNFLVIIVMTLTLGYLMLIALIYLLKYSKSFTFYDNEIKVKNKISLRSEIIPYNEINGYYQSSIDYKGFSQRVIMIVLNNKSKLILLQSNYFRFEDIEAFILNSPLTNLGKKEFSWTYIE